MHRRAARSRPQLVYPQLEDAQADPHTSPDEDLARSERISAFRRILDKLAEKKRTVFVLHEIEGLSPSEIAHIVGAPVLTVRTRLFYARRELAEMLRQEPSLASFADAFARSATQEKEGETDKAVEEAR
jgi:RNA polymerase sigma-70 factor (ECF subfamily)